MHRPAADLLGRRPALDVPVRARFYHGLADPSRLAILDSLRGGDRSAGDVAAVCGLTLSNASRHLDCLEDCGLVESRREWRHVYFSLAEGVGELLSANEAFVARIAGKVATCTRPEMGSSSS